MEVGEDVVLEIRNIHVMSDSEVSALGKLEVSTWQEIKGGSFEESLEAWRQETTDRILGFCFLKGGHPVGMTLFKRPPLSPAWVSTSSASIHGLKISSPWQGKGLGHHAFDLAISHMRIEWPDVNSLMLAVDADNVAALAIYRKFGMSDSGPIHEGNDGLEHRMRIDL